MLMCIAGGSPRAASPPLDRATSAPVFEDNMSLGSSGSEAKMRSPAAAAEAVGAARADATGAGTRGGGGGGASSKPNGGVRRRRQRARRGAAFDATAHGGYASEEEFLSVSVSLKASQLTAK